jgi:hypothetical protein
MGGRNREIRGCWLFGGRNGFVIGGRCRRVFVAAKWGEGDGV